jgi:hypothetical protein
MTNKTKKGNTKMKKIIALACALFSAGNIASAMNPEDQSVLINRFRFYIRVDMENNVIVKRTNPDINNFLIAISNIYTANPNERISSMESEFNHFLGILESHTGFPLGTGEENDAFAHFDRLLRALHHPGQPETVLQSKIISELENDGNVCVLSEYFFESCIISLMDKQREIYSFVQFFSQTQEFWKCINDYYERSTRPVTIGIEESSDDEELLSETM